MSWEQLNSIMRQAAQEAQQNRDLPPVACPNDGTPLQAGPDGELHCDFDGWIWNGSPVTW